MHTIDFVDPALQKQLAADGYGIIPSFVDADKIRKLEDFFYATRDESKIETDFYTSHWSSEREYRTKVNAYVQSELNPIIKSHFEHFKCLLGYYLFKKPSSSNLVYIHQDWSLIDESEYLGFTIWMPLVDTNSHNGCFQVVPGSHIDAARRGSNIAQMHNGLEKNLRSLPLSAGDAIIFDHRLVHSSPPNLSVSDRIAVGMVMIPEAAKVIHYFYDPDLQKEIKYELPDSFLIDSFYDHNKRKVDLFLPIE